MRTIKSLNQRNNFPRIEHKNCLFCQIAQHKISAKIQFENKEIIAFNDIHPQAPVHILIIPKKHISNINDLKQKDIKLISKLILTAQKIAKEKNIHQKGFRLVINTNKHAGQIINHLHIHILGGKQLGSIS